MRFGVDFGWLLWFERGNNSVSKKTVLPVFERQGGAERVFSIYVRTLPLLLLQRRRRYKTLSGRPSLNLLNDVHRDSKSSEYTVFVVFADTRVRVIKNDCISYTLHDHPKRVGQRLGEEQSYWRRPIGGKNAQTYTTNVILSRPSSDTNINNHLQVHIPSLETKITTTLYLYAKIRNRVFE